MPPKRGASNSPSSATRSPKRAPSSQLPGTKPPRRSASLANSCASRLSWRGSWERRGSNSARSRRKRLESGRRRRPGWSAASRRRSFSAVRHCASVPRPSACRLPCRRSRPLRAAGQRWATPLPRRQPARAALPRGNRRRRPRPLWRPSSPRSAASACRLGTPSAAEAWSPQVRQPRLQPPLAAWRRSCGASATRLLRPMRLLGVSARSTGSL
mmetsp:Transcript_75694/g.244948  ORF Transcript_75694/g.244948 Transcript_75694/m.244948 type:complete len:213 (-) Transcript_75694:662-1300(-)